MKRFDLAGKVALVTGASSGIGRRQSLALASAGANVVLLGRRKDQLEEAASELEQVGAKASVLPLDLADTSVLNDIADKAGAPFGPVDILINAAGINLRQPPGDITLESWDQTLRLNLTIPFFLARALVSTMQMRGWGKVINIASLQSSRAFPNGIAYGASKGGVAQLTRAMAEAWSAHGVGCNAIAPGFFPTELTAPVYENPEALDKLAAQTAMGRNGSMDDIDGLTVFLASAASDYITGQIIYLDGGFTAK